MKKILDSIKSNERQLLEIVVLAAVIVVPLFINLQDMFKVYLDSNPLSPDNFIWHIAITHGNYIASVIFSIFLLGLIRKFNSDFVMNRRSVYHDYSYAWYWFCAKVLGIKKCSLILVPIHMQFKLVIRGTFDEYPLEEDEYPVIDNEPECKVTKSNTDAPNNEINLILEDTYNIEDRQIPKAKRGLLTIKISRNHGGSSNGRHFSQNFIEATINTVRGIKRIPMMNVYATTNPMNTKHIAKRVFALDDRGNIEHLYVFQQDKSGSRAFEAKGHQIF